MVVKIKVKNVSFSYGSIKALENVSFEIENEFVGIIGPNGSGKTTLLNCMAGFLKSDGCILINGKDINKLDRKKVAREIGIVPQIPNISFPLTVFDIVLMGRNPHKKMLEFMNEKDIKIANDAMEAVGIEHLADRTITELSGGELQKVIIARALAQQPNILLLDEPTAHLDIHHQIEILSLIKSLIGKGITAIAVLHDLNLASCFCDKIILLNKGKIFAIGNVKEVITPDNIYTVYGIRVDILQHPKSKKPVIIFPE
ncbi:MAG: hypothetical protein DRN29_03865 [Thermoplasmata archaeon]|nr:MAG: hypothetical protein DRN29_03865 [Thermoplasmata archaeon]HDN96176.1 ABC transporter ATP-binding protein [Thermoplasmatales archaeon]